MARLIVTDSGGVERALARLLVVDSGGTTRRLKRLFVVDSGGVSRLVFGAIVTLSGETITASSASIDPDARLEVNGDGNVYKWVNGVRTQIDSATDWLVPEDTAPDDYQVRFTNLTGAALDASTVAENVWHPLSSGTFTLTQQRAQAAGAGQDQSVFDLQIRKGTGPVIASASYTLNAVVI